MDNIKTIRTYRKDTIEEDERILKDRILISIINTIATPLTEECKSRYLDVLELRLDDLPWCPNMDNALADERLNDIRELRVFDKTDYDKVVEFVKKYNTIERVDIHCSAGVSRSGAIAVGITMLKDDNALFQKVLRENFISPNERILSIFHLMANPLKMKFSFRNMYSILNEKRMECDINVYSNSSELII